MPSLRSLRSLKRDNKKLYNLYECSIKEVSRQEDVIGKLNKEKFIAINEVSQLKRKLDKQDSIIQELMAALNAFNNSNRGY